MSTCKCWNEFHTVCQNFSTSPEPPRVCQKVWQIHSKQTLNTCAKAKAMRAHKQTHTNGVGNNPPPHAHTSPDTSTRADKQAHRINKNDVYTNAHACVCEYVCVYIRATYTSRAECAHVCGHGEYVG